MRHPRMMRAARAFRVWRAVAFGFSLTAVALNAVAQRLTWGEVPEPPPHKGLAPQAKADEPAPDGPPRALRSDAPSARVRDDQSAAAALLAARFKDAADADLAEIAEQLASLGGSRAREVLFRAARSIRPTLRVAALDALGTLDTADVHAFMLEQLNGAEPSLGVVNYFAGCQEPRALPALERLARSAPPTLRSAVLASLFNQGADAEPTVARLLQGDEALVQALLETEPTTAAIRRALRQASVWRLQGGAITGGRVFEFLERDLSAEAREALRQATRDPASAARALAALANRGDRASLRALQQLANDSDRELAARATCQLRSQTGARGRSIKWRP